MISHRLLEPDWSTTSRSVWDDLVRSCPDATPFQTSAWLNAWWVAFGRAHVPHILGVFEGADLVAAMPLYATSFPWRALRTVGTGNSDYLAPLVRPGYLDAFAESLREYVDSLTDIDLIDLHQIRENNPLVAGWPEVEVQARCCVLELTGTFGEYTKGLSKSLRYEVKRLGKPTYSAGIATAESPEQAVQYLQDFFGLHARRWHKRGLPGAFASRRIRAFHEAFVADAVRHDELRLSVLFHEGTVVGAVYAMKARTGTYFYQSGFEPAAKSLSPGTVLVAHSIRRAFEDGCAVFDFLRGDEPYKLRWKPQSTYANVRLIRSLGGVRGSAGQKMNRVGSRIESTIRRRLEGRGLLS